MDPIRIHLGPMPAMLGAIIEDLLARETDLVVVGRTAAGDDPLLQAREEQADMLITSEAADSTSPCLRALLAAAPLSILAIAHDGRQAHVLSLATRPIGFDEEDRTSFAQAVRQAARLRP